MKKYLFYTFVCLACTTTMYGQNSTYSATVNSSSGSNYSVNIEIELTDIVPAQNSCEWGYNYDVAYDYDIQIVGDNPPANLYTLAGYLTCGSNSGIYFNLPNSGGSGSNVTQGNPWNSNSNCATATIESLLCDSISIQIGGPGIPNQTIALELNDNEDNGDDQDWGMDGNNADTTSFIGTTNANPLVLRTNNIERMRISEEGNIGIGVANPLEKFELQGNMKLSGDMIFSDYTDMNDSIGKFLLIDQNGRTNAKSLDQLKSLIYREVEVDRFDICDLAGGPAQNPSWYSAPYKLYSRCPDVKVGIGTNSPQKSLDVRGTIQSSKLEIGGTYSSYSLISGFRTSQLSAPLLTLGQYNTQDQVEHITLSLTSAGELKLNYRELPLGNYASTGQILTISNENRKLLYLKNSNETLYARRIVVDQKTWADYVFKENYVLTPLNQLEVFIKENGHLPNIPSEEQVIEEGIDLANMNKVLLEKIEELTLYTIQQQKELDELKILIEKLSK